MNITAKSSLKPRERILVTPRYLYQQSIDLRNWLCRVCLTVSTELSMGPSLDAHGGLDYTNSVMTMVKKEDTDDAY